MSLKKMSKDGQTFYDVDDSEESVSQAKAKGYKEFIPMTKNGQDVFNVEFSEDSYTAAVKKGYKDLERFNFENSKTPQKVGAGEAFAVKGIGNAFGIADELTGLAGAVVNPTDSDKGFLDRYRDSRDYAREGDDAAFEQQPAAYMGGRIVGGVAGGALAPALNTLKGSAALGAGMGLGDSKADLTKPSLENFGEAALDTGLGAAAGALGYGVGKGIEKAVPVAKDSLTYLKAFGRGTARGTKEAMKEPMAFGLNQPLAVVKGFKEAIAEIRAVTDDLKGLKAVANQARQIRPLSELSGREVQVIGNGKTVGEFTDDEAIIAALTAEGDNPVKQWFAEKAATLYPGQIKASEYNEILSMGPEARSAAREFDPREAAKGLKPVIEDTQNLFTNARNDIFKKYQDKARASFDPATATPAFRALDEALESAMDVKSIPGSVKNVLDDVEQMLYYGTGIKQWKLNPGNWEKVGSTEQFNRLQKARELIDDQIKWTDAKGGLSTAQSVLMDVRKNIDDVLKFSPDKVDADDIYAASKRVEKNFFDATDFRGSGIDEGKIKALLGDTSTAHRFRSSMEEFRNFVSDPELDPVFREQGQKLIDQIENATNTMAQKGQLGAFRQSQGPTSPAVERMQSIQGKDSILQDAVKSPAGFVNSMDEFNKIMTKKLGKPLAKLEPEAKKKAIQFYVYTRKNPNMSPAQYEAKFKELFPNAENQQAIDMFLKASPVIAAPAFFMGGGEKKEEKKEEKKQPEGPGRLMRDDEFGLDPSGMSAPIPGASKLKGGINDFINEFILEAIASKGYPNAAAAVATPLGMAADFIPESFGEFAPGMAALPPSLKKGNKIDFAKAKEFLTSKPKPEIGQVLSPADLARKRADENARVMQESSKDRPAFSEGDNLPTAREKFEQRIKNSEPVQSSTERYLNQYNPKDRKRVARFIAGKGPSNEPYIGNDMSGPLYHHKVADVSGQIPVEAIDVGGHLGKNLSTGGADPFAWLETKYGTSKKILEENKGKPLKISTRSDLISHDDYITNLVPGKNEVEFFLSTTDKNLHKALTPAAPAVSRVIKAAMKLRDAGIKVSIVREKLKGIPDGIIPFDELSLFRESGTRIPIKTIEIDVPESADLWASDIWKSIKPKEKASDKMGELINRKKRLDDIEEMKLFDKTPDGIRAMDDEILTFTSIVDPSEAVTKEMIRRGLIKP